MTKSEWKQDTGAWC